MSRNLDQCQTFLISGIKLGCASAPNTQIHILESFTGRRGPCAQWSHFDRQTSSDSRHHLEMDLLARYAEQIRLAFATMGNE